VLTGWKRCGTLLKTVMEVRIEVKTVGSELIEFDCGHDSLKTFIEEIKNSEWITINDDVSIKTENITHITPAGEKE